MVLINKTGKTVEFLFDGKPQIFAPGEKKIVDGVIAHHALYQVNTKLQEYKNEEEEEKTIFNMPWKELISLASKKGVFKPGLSREELIKRLQGLWINCG